jgi:hypothetical protein
MLSHVTARVVYLIAFPSPGVGRQRAQAPAPLRGAPAALTKAAPHFQALDVEIADLDESAVTLQGQPIHIRRQLIDGQVQSVECRYELADLLNPAANTVRQALNLHLREHVLRTAGYSGPFIEEYTILCLSAAPASPDAFVDEHRLDLAPLLRSEGRAFTPAEAEHILASRARYGDTDLTVVDWEGALIIDPDGDFHSEVELLKLGNYQLVRYRLLDRAIELNLETVRRELAAHRRFRLGGGLLRETLEQRLTLLLDFEKSEQLLLLIGDWYTAQLYRIIVDEFYIDEWKAAVHTKLDQLESITDTVRANFSLTWGQFLDLVQLVGWLVLLVGYFVLFYFDVAGLGK